MKKLLVLLLCVLLAGGCSKKEETVPGLPNPLTSYESVESLSKAMEMAVVGFEGVENEVFQTINSDYLIGEYRFTINGHNGSLRMSKADYTVDISGIYVDGGTLFDSDSEYAHYIENDEGKYYRYFTADGQYVLAVDDAGEFDYTVFNDLQVLQAETKPYTWPNDLSFEDYVSVSGFYMNDNLRAFVSIYDFDLNFGVYGDYGSEQTFMLTGSGALKDGVLTFEKGALEVYTANFAELVDLQECGGGTITFDESGMTFSSGILAQVDNQTLTSGFDY